MKKKIILFMLFFLLITIFGVLFYINYSLNKVSYITQEDENNIVILEETFDIEENINSILTEKSEEIYWNNIESDTNKIQKDNITNILLCGEENMSGAIRGRTDSIILVTINKEEKTLRMVSFMRDLYVPIEGYKNNKLNAAYAIGGMPLLVSTIENNFNIKIDGYVLVDFSQFENIINMLGGVDIELTQKEVNYLNSSNYISDEKSRNLKVGVQRLNGSQALGYSRIRHVATKDGLNNDFGRIWRQKQVLLSLYEEYKEISYLEMIDLLPNILETVTTNLTKEELVELGLVVLSMKDSPLEQTYVPFEGYYSCANVNGMSVLYIENIEEMRIKLEKIINGSNMEEVLNTEYTK